MSKKRCLDCDCLIGVEWHATSCSTWPESVAKELPQPREFGLRLIGLTALKAADINVPLDASYTSMDIADHVGTVIYELAPGLVDALTDELARFLAEQES